MNIKHFSYNNCSNTLFCLVVLLYFFCCNNAIAEVSGDSIAGRNKISMCVGCHGIKDYKTAFPKTYRVPKIAGQRNEYIVSALKAYRSGERNHPSMMAVASSMTDQDIADVAAFYSTQR